jgi:glycosyltransferase involved in cell wall biosynthesis
MKKRIYWLFPHLEQDGGGTKFLLEVTKRLSKRYDITIICNTGTSEIIDSFQQNGTKVVTTSFIAANSNLYWLFLPAFLLFDFIKLIPHLKKADTVITTMYPSNLLAYLYDSLFHKKYYYYCYEPFPYLQNTKFIASQPPVKMLLMSLFAFLYSWTDNVAVRNAITVFTLNNVTQRMIRQTYGRKSIMTFMGVDTRHFRPYLNNPVNRKYKDRVLIIHSTDYSLLKRTDLAIDAVKRIVKDHPEVLLLITATYHDSQNKKIYELLVSKYRLSSNVTFLDYLDYKVLPMYYAASRCYLSCSYDEMLGTTTSNLPVKESLACETPAIRAPVTNEDVIDGVSGFLIDPRNTEGVAEKLSFFVNNEKKAKAMGKAGRKTITKRYSWDKVADILVDHLNR